MNSITKIGKIYLTKYFSKKPTFIKGLNQKWFTKVIFSNKPIELSITTDLNFIQAHPLNYRFYKIWSGEIGLLSLELKKDQTLLKGIVRKLNKLQKEDAPSHIIVVENTTKDGNIPEVTTTYTIYRLTDSQELLISNDYLLPCINKKDAKLDAVYFKQQQDFEKEHQKYLEKSKLEKEKNLQKFEEAQEFLQEQSDKDWEMLNGGDEEIHSPGDWEEYEKLDNEEFESTKG